MTWSVKLVELVIAGQARDFPISRIDDLIAWIIERDTPATRLISTAFSARSVQRNDGVQLSLAVLDAVLFTVAGTAWEALGLAPGSDEKHTRTRYRRLLGIFHPDRQLGSAEWCHERTDQLNRAFRRIQEEQGDTAMVGLSPGGPLAGNARQRSGSPSPAVFGVGDAVRSSMGGSRSFQRNFFSLFIAGAAVILLLLYYAGVEPDGTAALANNEQFEYPVPAQTGLIPARVEQEERQVGPLQENEPDYDFLLAGVEPAGKPAALASNEQFKDPVPVKMGLIEAGVEQQEEAQVQQLQENAPDPVLAEVSTPANTESPELVDVSATDVQIQRPEESAAAEPQALVAPAVPAQTLSISHTEPIDFVSVSVLPVELKQLPSAAQTILADPVPQLRPVLVDVCTGIDLFLADFSQYYQRGDLDRYLDLYTEDAVENDARGKADISNIYADFFGATSDRAIFLQVISRDSPNNELCLLAADFSAQYLDQSGQQQAVAAQIQFQLAPVDGGSLLISRMQY